MDSRATHQCNMWPYVYAVYWLPPASSGFLLARKCNWLAEKMLITCVMRNAQAHKLQWSGPTVHSSTVPSPCNVYKSIIRVVPITYLRIINKVP